jgi:lipoprotein signal peptidase
VTDFLKFFTDDPDMVSWLNAKLGMAEWPSFNVADSCIVVGVLVFFVYTLIQDRKNKGKPDELADDGPLPELDQAIE